MANIGKIPKQVALGSTGIGIGRFNYGRVKQRNLSRTKPNPNRPPKLRRWMMRKLGSFALRKMLFELYPGGVK